MPERRPARYTFACLHEATTDLDGPARLAAFGELPEVLQREAWADLRERMDYRAERDFEDWCLEDWCR